MATDKLEQLLAGPLEAPVYYLASTEQDLLREAAARLRRALLAAGGTEDEATRIDGPSPDIGEVVAAAGAVSFFGTRRVVELWEIAPSSIGDKDAAELGELFGEVSSAVLVVSALYKDKKTATSKKAKLLFDAAATAGVALELEKPSRRDNLEFIHAAAQAVGASFAPGAAEALLEAAGESRPLLENETAKLAAICGYGAITKAAVEQYGVHNIEADVFELARAITGGQKAAAFGKLNQLLGLRHEPIAIAAALAGTYVDMLRVSAGVAAKKNVSVIFKEMGYKGNDYRLKKALENARAYTPAGLEGCVRCLAGLDRQLKSSALPDKSILLQAAVGELILLRGRS
ncbi:DNA polymerase III subunit delta [Ruminococcaceae bacterium OttesenSCG-928-D13]|nr:DNA polymerase III subunit delta [Ruminococcaceae bacterium OttesenSCG-928-D13]